MYGRTEPHCRKLGFAAGLALAGLVALGGPLQAQPAPDPRLVAAQTLFDALPEAERKAIQTDLIWTGHLSALASGSFGALTFRAINAAKGARGPADGMLQPADRQALASAAAAARKAVGFRLVDDSRTGVRIGIPATVLPRQEVTPAGGSRWQSADGRITLDTSSSPAGEELAPLFERATNASVQGRRITYKLLRPDFFVVAGETQTGKFYRRLSAGPEGLRGFSIGYDKALAATVDRLVIGIANSFEAFPTGAAPAPAGTAIAANPQQVPVSTTPVAAPRRHPAGLSLGGTKLLVALTTLENCRAPRAAGRQANIAARDEALGLAVLDVPGATLPAGPALSDSAPAAGNRVVLLALGDEGGKPAPVAAAGEIASGAAGLTVNAALQPGQSGAPVFDRSGRLSGIIARAPAEAGLVAGIAPARNHAFVDATRLKAFQDKAGVAPATGGSAAAEQTTGAIVAERAPALVPLVCGG